MEEKKILNKEEKKKLLDTIAEKTEGIRNGAQLIALAYDEWEKLLESCISELESAINGNSVALTPIYLYCMETMCENLKKNQVEKELSLNATYKGLKAGFDLGSMSFQTDKNGKIVDANSADEAMRKVMDLIDKLKNKEKGDGDDE